MIKPEELRIGNYFEWNSLASMGRGIDKVDIQNIAYSSFMNPISITEDILIKAGFEKVIESEDYIEYNLLDKYENKIVFAKLKKEESFTLREFNRFDGEDNYQSPIPMVKSMYLHEFQNSFYYFTGTELKIQL